MPVRHWNKLGRLCQTRPDILGELKPLGGGKLKDLIAEGAFAHDSKTERVRRGKQGEWDVRPCRPPPTTLSRVASQSRISSRSSFDVTRFDQNQQAYRRKDDRRRDCRNPTCRDHT